MASTSSDVAAERTIPARLSKRASRWRSVARFTRQKPLGALSAVVIVAVVVLAAAAPLVAPFDPLEMHIADRLAAPGSKYMLGADDIGRDVFSRLVFGARVSLMVGLVAVLMGTVTGTFLGIISGYFGGKVDAVIQRVADSFMSFPGLVFLMAVVAVLGAGIGKAVIAIGILLWPGASRVVRGVVMSTKENLYVEAARAIGASNLRILVRHILPNVLAPIIILASVMLGSAILLEASLGFLGLGAKPPQPSWGSMLSAEGRSFMEQAPWLAIAPGVAISITVLAFNLLGDSIRDVLDPRLRGQGGKLRGS